MLGENARFLRLQEGSKRPKGSYSEGKRNRLKGIPQDGNYGIIPQRLLLVLDIDAHGGQGAVEEQVDAFSALLGTDLRTTFTVKTPSGGYHFYLFIPLDAYVNVAKLPRMNLRVYADEIAEVTGMATAIDADIRSEAANAYAVGPSSSLPKGSYTCINFVPPVTMPHQGLSNLLLLEELKVAKKLKAKQALKARAVAPELWSEEEEQGRSNALPSQAELERVRSGLRRKAFKTYHQSRAFAYYALSCCYTVDAVAEACMDLDLNRDSAKRTPVPRHRIVSDLKSIELPEPGHSTYCAAGHGAKAAYARERAKGRQSFEDYYERRVVKAREQLARDQQYYRPGTPKVIDIVKVHEALMETTNRKVMPLQIRHCLAIVENFLQPLSNLGVRKILLARARIAADLDMTESQVTQALRVLRKVGVIEVAKKQAPGLAASYYVSDRFKDQKLTGYLKTTWANTWVDDAAGEPFHPSLIYLPRTPGIVQAYTGELAHTNAAFAKLANTHAEILAQAGPKRDLFPAVQAVLRNEGRKRGLRVAA